MKQEKVNFYNKFGIKQVAVLPKLSWIFVSMLHVIRPVTSEINAFTNTNNSCRRVSRQF